MKSREKMLLWIIAGLVGLFVLDRLVVTRVMDGFDRVAEQTEQAESRYEEAQALVDSQRAIRLRHAGYQQASLPNNDADAARQLISQWARDAGVEVSIFSPGKQTRGEQYDEKVFTFTGKGSMAQVEQLLWSLRTAPIPLRVERCTMTSSDQTRDELTVTLSLTTILKATGGENGGTP
ncbi:MAG: hypothetical protein AAGH88_09730 [Planctomycetota bacterium]